MVSRLFKIPRGCSPIRHAFTINLTTTREIKSFIHTITFSIYLYSKGILTIVSDLTTNETAQTNPYTSYNQEEIKSIEDSKYFYSCKSFKRLLVFFKPYIRTRDSSGFKFQYEISAEQYQKTTIKTREQTLHTV